MPDLAAGTPYDSAHRSTCSWHSNTLLRGTERCQAETTAAVKDTTVHANLSRTVTLPAHECGVEQNTWTVSALHWEHAQADAHLFARLFALPVSDHAYQRLKHVAVSQPK